MNNHFKHLDFIDAKKNVNKQGTKILHDIVDAYQKGIFDEPSSAAGFCSLLACICEGKIIGTMNEEKMKVEWTLSDKYEEHLQKLKQSLLEKNVVQGPWSQKFLRGDDK